MVIHTRHTARRLRGASRRAARWSRAQLARATRLSPLPENEYERIRSVGIFLGPYRNLTTLTASILSLHPQCQILNHGGPRVFVDPRLDFIRHPSDAHLRRFLQFAAVHSKGGSAGDGGGSITLSHAFRNDCVRDAYEARFGHAPSKRAPTSYVWKESLAVSRALRSTSGSVAALLESSARIRLLVPVRHPIDCAISNLRSGHANRFDGPRPRTEAEVLRLVVEELAWALRLEESNQGRVFSFFSSDIDEGELSRLAAFLRLDPDPLWLEDAVRCFEVKPSYEHSRHLVREYQRLVEVNFGEPSRLREKMRSFVSQAA